MRRFHASMMVVWTLLLIPTLVWWKDSILWVSFMSLYAIVISHWAAWMAGRAEHAAEE